MNGGHCPRLIPIFVTNIGRLRLPFLFGVKIMKISVLGCGRWGSCIAWYLDRIGHEVVSCGLENAPELQQLLKTHHNDYLTFPESITVTYDHQFAIERAEVIVISISAQYLRDYMQTITRYDLDGKTIVLCMKGIEESTGKRLTEVVSDFVDTDKTPVAVWVGPADLIRRIHRIYG